MVTELEHILTSSYKSEMISYLKSHPENFEEAIRLAISDKQPYSWWAAWLLWSCMENNDQRIKRYIKKIINTLTTHNDNQRRELFIILQKMELNDEDDGKLFDVCVDVWKKNNKKASVRYNAFKLCVKIAKNHPDLFNDILFLTQQHYIDSLSVGVQKSILKMIGECKQLSTK